MRTSRLKQLRTESLTTSRPVRPVASSRRGVALAIIVFLFAGGAACWWHVAAVAGPDMRAHSPNPAYRSVQSSDLYPRWVGVREAILHHRSPYGAQVTAEIQRGYYGTTSIGPKADQQKFAYPAYFVSLFFWAGLIPFSVVSAAAWFLLPALAALATVYGLRFVCGNSNPRREALWAALVLGSWPVAEAVWVQQPILLILAAMVGVAVCATRQQPLRAGFLLACCTIKPHLAAAFVAWWLLWALLHWHERRRLVYSFAVTMLALLGTAQIIVPGWLGQWSAELKQYVGYTYSGFIFQAVLGLKLGLWITLLAAALPLLLAFRLAFRRNSEALAVALVLAATLLASPTHALGAYNQVLLLPAAIVLWRAPWPTTLPAITVRAGAWVLLAWGQIGSLLALTFTLLRPVLAVRPQVIMDLPLYNFLCLPLVVVVALWQVHSSALGSPDSQGRSPQLAASAEFSR